MNELYTIHPQHKKGAAGFARCALVFFKPTG
jgi:hypothetical protein